ncbi:MULTISPECIES: type 1 glycerol-3-phosphate oxidase [Enterococcus]|uniref:Alpha-glycerophosphate oxidase n=1 Tax=Enterococcus mundtii TaxID=53346 RepID=A0A1L8V0E4_ENTMU|nr:MULTISPECIES: type 1 glycerol-3-phosphate oxidase [Enterococcus]GEN17952.1 glycerol-3-phosphate dehydrogenase [Ligilactobacillus acidipiscis]AUB51577.1 alpha-glycerophosphate oxidase [Enterococcus mundtii]MDB7086469.1 type 1 glycerol-3-phosphate oxidase [Enterococcus mundtii]MZZ59272.1 type 1 glycerol-3-phosphate oxidase [Enterococcus mundtii]MZZ62270.1 type 1 glycerol-3-phosphate oxidase [Enterococcus mundtii]
MFSKKTRQDNIDHMKQEELDLLIIGGGITGAGVAIQAAASGIKTGLIEMQDFAEGTSSRSTKLVHGGIRYLKTFDVEVVADTVGERAVVQQVAPHIPKPDPMLLPIYEGEGATTFNMFSVKVAMDLYDKLAKVTGTKYENYTLTPEEVLEREPFLKKDGLTGAGVYLDFRNNDSRLVIDNIKKAAEDGAYLVSKMKATGFIYEGDQIIGVKARDLLSDEVIEIRAKVVINTSGPWVDKIRNLNFKRAISPKMRPTKGVHLVVDAKKLPVPQPTYFDTGKQDGRMVFAIPRENKTYFGTTDTDYQGDFTDPQVTQEDVDYLLDVINHRYPEANITLADIESSWAGLRPLLIGNAGSDYNGGDNGSISDKSFRKVVDTVTDYKESKVSRVEVEDVLNHLESSRDEKAPSTVSRGSSLEREPDGLVTLSGGKITDYRKMAEGAMKLIRQLLQEEYGVTVKEIDSKTYSISGGDFDPTKQEEMVEEYTKIGVEAGLDEKDAAYIADFYGTNAKHIFELAKEMSPYPGLTLAESARLRYGLENEMVLVPGDYLIRRTNHLLFERDQLDAIKQPIIDAIAAYFEWTDEEKERETQHLEQLIAESDLRDLKGEK